MLIVNDEHRIAAGMKSLSKQCPYCRKPLRAYPLILSDDAGFVVLHAACAAALAIEIQVDLYTFFRPPAPYHQLFVLTAQVAAQNDDGNLTLWLKGCGPHDRKSTESSNLVVHSLVMLLWICVPAHDTCKLAWTAGSKL